jgi:hypothetical protein
MRVKHAGALPRQTACQHSAQLGETQVIKLYVNAFRKLSKEAAITAGQASPKELLKAALSGGVCSRCSLWVFNEADSNNARLGT